MCQRGDLDESKEAFENGDDMMDFSMNGFEENSTDIINNSELPDSMIQFMKVSFSPNTKGFATKKYIH